MKRILAFVLTVLLLMSILAVPAFAEEGTGENPGTSQGEGATGGNGGTEGGNGGSEGGNGGTEGGNGGTEGGNGGSEGGNGGSEGGNSGSQGGTGSDTTLPCEHTYGEWTEGETTHSRKCSKCGHLDASAHAWVFVEQLLAPTCKEYGLNGYICSVCSAEGIEGVDYAPHTYDNVCDDTCNVCEATRVPEHKFSTQWSKSSTKHWHPCIGSTGCKAKSGEADHYPGPAATEEKAQYCLTCGLMMMPKKSHTHDYATTLSSDASGHWYACSGCEEKKDFTAHTYDDLCDPDCNACGFTSETAHSFDDNWESDENGHWSVCSLCGEQKPSEAHIPGAEPTDTEAQLCTVCGFELAPALIHVHEAGAIWQTDEASHWHTCECGEKMDQADHTWDEGVENEDTTVTYVCTACQAEKTEGEPKTESEFPVWILLMGVSILCAIAALVLVLVMVLKNRNGKYKN